MVNSMNGFYDIHCHILPHIDDGAQDSKTMLGMMKIAYQEGIRCMIATPHYHPRRGEADLEIIQPVFEKAKKVAEEHFPDLKLYVGNEIYYRQDAKELLKGKKILTLADSNYVLIEFSTAADKIQIKSALSQMQMAGFMPVIAHVERYEALVSDFECVKELATGGVYFQANASSITGDDGGSVKRFLKKMVKEDCLHFVGTDAHSMHRRAPLMKKCAKYLSKKFGEDTVIKLLMDNPSKIIQNKII